MQKVMTGLTRLTWCYGLLIFWKPGKYLRLSSGMEKIHIIRIMRILIFQEFVKAGIVLRNYPGICPWIRQGAGQVFTNNTNYKCRSAIHLPGREKPAEAGSAWLMYGEPITRINPGARLMGYLLAMDKPMFLGNRTDRSKRSDRYPLFIL